MGRKREGQENKGEKRNYEKGLRDRIEMTEKQCSAVCMMGILVILPSSRSSILAQCNIGHTDSPR